MAAPMFHRFCRRFDRIMKPIEKPFPRFHNTARLYRKQAKVYDLTSNASREMGAFSMKSPAELMEVVNDFQLPTKYVWVEFDFQAFKDGEGQLPVSWLSGEDNTRRMAILLESNIHETLEDGTVEGAGWGAAAIYLSNGGDMTPSPLWYAVCRPEHRKWYWGKILANYEEPSALEDALGRPLKEVPLGTVYCDQWRNEQPRKFKELVECTGVGYFPCTKKHIHKLAAMNSVTLLNETGGLSRIIIAAMAAIMTAKGARYLRPVDGDPEIRERRQGGSQERYEPTTYDVYLTPKAVPGHTLLKGARDAARMRLHEVAGHWCYRQHEDGRDPTKCTVGAHHDWEDIDGTVSQECILCGQRRWWRDAFKRGDETLGVVPKKVTRIRA